LIFYVSWLTGAKAGQVRSGVPVAQGGRGFSFVKCLSICLIFLFNPEISAK
jgi:hypothetical protein